MNACPNHPYSGPNSTGRCMICGYRIGQDEQPLSERQKAYSYRVSWQNPESIARILMSGIPLLHYENGIFYFPLSDCGTGAPPQI